MAAEAIPTINVLALYQIIAFSSRWHDNIPYPQDSITTNHELGGALELTTCFGRPWTAIFFLETSSMGHQDQLKALGPGQHLSVGIQMHAWLELCLLDPPSGRFQEWPSRPGDRDAERLPSSFRLIERQFQK